MEPQFNEGPKDWQNLFAIATFCYIEGLFYIFTIIGVKKLIIARTSLYRALLNQDSTVYREISWRHHA